MKRAILIEGIGKELELSGATVIKLKKTDKEFIYLDKMKDGRWKLVYTEKTIPKIEEVTGLKIIRED